MKPYKNQDPIRLVVADVDGTLVTQEKGLTAKDAKLRNVWDGFCLEEATELSPGFNPGNHPSKRFALKGRQIRRRRNGREEHIYLGAAIDPFCAGAHYFSH